MRQTKGFSHRADKMEYILVGLLFSKKLNAGVWRSWLARAVWDREVAGSSPATPTKVIYLC